MLLAICWDKKFEFTQSFIKTTFKHQVSLIAENAGDKPSSISTKLCLKIFTENFLALSREINTYDLMLAKKEKSSTWALKTEKLFLGFF
jgi:hypothetical protein